MVIRSPSASIMFPLCGKVNPILGATMIKCKSTIISSGFLCISLTMTLADLLPIPFIAVKSVKLIGMF
jgi:hypothetical protein